MIPTDIRRLLFEFCGPWTLKEALKTCYENVCYNMEEWDVTTVNWETAFEGPDGSCDPVLSFQFSWHSPCSRGMKITLTMEVERENWAGCCTNTSKFDFQSLEHLLEYLPKLDCMLPKGVHQVEPILVYVEESQHHLFYGEEDMPTPDPCALMCFKKWNQRFFKRSLREFFER